MIRKLFFALALSLVASAPALAQSPVAGTWQAEVARRVENVNGQERTSDVALIHYTLEVQGDSVFATSRVLDAPADVPQRKLRGTFQNGVLRLVSEPQEARIRTGDGAENRVQMIMELELKLEGDVLSGTQQANSVDGVIQGPPRPFRATRVRS